MERLFYKKDIVSLEEGAVAQGISMETLMERAGKALAEEIFRRAPEKKRAVLLCGDGNNGGDGFVCARILAEAGWSATVLLCGDPPKTELAGKAFLQLPQDKVTCLCMEHQREEGEEAISQAEVVADCVFGFGFHGELPQKIQDIFALAEKNSCLKIACDLPSGAGCDTGRVSRGTFRADVTVTFTGQKPACCSYPARRFSGETVTASVGIPEHLVEKAEAKGLLLDKSFPKKLLRPLDVESNKGSAGRLLLVCGSYGMMGACLMAARAALRTGVGLLELAVDRRIYPLLAAAVPEAIFTPISREEKEGEEQLSQALSRAKACLLGCGLGEQAEEILPFLLENSRVPLVVDADGLNALAKNPGARKFCESPLILTPHPGEMARLSGKSVSEIQENRLETALQQAKRWNAVVALKGAGTVVAGPEGRYFVNSTGNPGMAKGGSGDVLAGMIASLLAQGISPMEAAGLGVVLHGMAGDRCARSLSRRAMLPTDLVETLPEIFSELEQ